MTIAVDFDGTIVEHRYPSIGKPKPFAVETLTQLMRDGHRLILWTSREGALLQEAVDWCEKQGIRFYAVNSNYPDQALVFQSDTKSAKVTADLYIDDRNVGGLPSWDHIYRIISGKEAARSKHRSRRKGLFGLFRKKHHG